ncbi:MAG: M14 family metallopeptidase [Gammaproteobacteria bacterium]
MLTTYTKFKKALFDVPAHRLHEYLPGPCLFHLEGERSPALFLSVLLHGNESSGWDVVKRLLDRYKGKSLPRSLSILVGNVKAARYRKRKLQSQPDYNRVWASGNTPEHDMMQSILDTMQQRGVFASIDIHNNNGLNPHYACTNRLDLRYLGLAREFSRMVIYFVRPSGVQSLAFAKHCPAVTLECGQPGDEYGIQLATNYVDKVLNMKSIKPAKNIQEDIDLYHTVGVVKIPDDVSISFNTEPADVRFINGIERLNFEEIPASTTLAQVNSDIERPMIVLDEDGKDIFADYFRIDAEQLQTTACIMPAMLTDKIIFIRQDCFFYLMEKYDISMGEKTIDTQTSVWS